MSPALSTARLGMKRFFESGAHVACCFGADATAPPVTGSWYHRTCARFGDPPLPTVWVSQSDSVPPMCVYWFCIISRYESESRLFPWRSGTVEGPTLKVPIVALVGPVNVELAVFVQST